MNRKSASDAHFDQLLARVHAAGREVISPAAGAVDRDASFPVDALAVLRKMRLLGAYVPQDLGGLGFDVVQVARLCEVLGQYCGSVAMIFAMHQIQVACLVHHGMHVKFFRDYLRALVAEQRLIASATSEVGTGGDLRSSICAAEMSGDRLCVVKRSPVVSYGAEAEDILLTCRRSASASPSDQVLVLAARSDCVLERMCGWDTLGFRGTCSSGYVVRFAGSPERLLAVPFADVLSRTMQPIAHILWGSLWLGIAEDAVQRARTFVRTAARRDREVRAVTSLRLAEVEAALQDMRSNISSVATEYRSMLAQSDGDPFDGYAFAIRVNNLKLSASTHVVEIVNRAMRICGLAAYRNDSEYSLCRHLRDAYGAALMVNNDRILDHNATMLLAQREG